MNDKISTLPDCRERDSILDDLDVNILVEAAAGTGKTTSLIGRMMNLIREGKCTAEGMAAVTFTRKAAAEMRSRFQVELEKTLRSESGLVHQRISDALGQIEHCFIGTIHSFCARLLRERPVEAGVDIAFREIDDLEDRLIRREAWDEWVAGLYAYDDPILTELQEAGLEIGALVSTYQKMADYPDIDEWPAPPTPMPNLQPIREALLDYAAHMEQMNPTLPDDPGNDEIIPKYRTILRLVKYHNLSDPVSFMKVLEEFKKSKIIQKQWPGGKNQALAERDRWDSFRETYVIPTQQKWYARRYEISLRAILPAIKRYEGKKKRDGVLNFQDLLLLTASMLKRWPSVRRYFQQRISRLLVDEFQDTDPIQAEIMMLLTCEDISEKDWRRSHPRAGSLFVVGDPKQSIYRFRRADIVTYNQVKKIIQQNGGRILHLSSNFRTDPTILDWVNQKFQSQFPETETPYSPTYVPLQHGKPQTTLPDEEKIKKLTIPQDKTNKNDCSLYESSFIARWIHEEIQSGRAQPEDFMIVTYLTKNLNLYARQLEKFQIPCQVTGGDALNQVEELRLLTLCLTAINQPWNPIALVGVLRNELFGFSDSELYAFKKHGGEFSYGDTIPSGLPAEVYSKYNDAFTQLRLYRSWIKTLPPSTAIEKICDRLGLFACGSAFPGANLRCGCLAKAIAVIRSSPDRFISIGDIVDFFHQLIQNEIKLDGISASPPQKSFVRIMNLHKVKGLEAPVVFLADPSGKTNHEADLHIDRLQDAARAYLKMEQENPQSYHRKLLAQPADWDRYSAEEQQFGDAEKIRLFYVAATRCKRQLIITQREKGNHHNPWNFFNSYLENVPIVDSPVTSPLSKLDPTSWKQSDIDLQMDSIRKRWEKIIVPTYSVNAISRMDRDEEWEPSSREEGIQWGNLIHAVLEALIRNPDSALEKVVAKSIRKHNLNPGWHDDAIRQIQTVQQSSIWQRALRSPKRFAEVPIRIQGANPLQNDKPLLLRGAIDLIFQEKDGWVLVDYKTDGSAQNDVEPLVEKYRRQIQSYAWEWERITDNPVVEKGIYFTEIDRFVEVN